MIRAFPGWDCGDWSRTAVGLVTATRNWACYRLAVVTVHPILTCSDTGSFLQSARGRSGLHRRWQSKRCALEGCPAGWGVALHAFPPQTTLKTG